MKTGIALFMVVLVITSVASAELIHWWKLDETTLIWNGSVWVGVTDSVTNDASGQLWGYTAAQDLTTVVGKGGAVAGDYSYDFIEPSGISAVCTLNPTAVPATGDFTILVWMNTTNLHTAQGHLFSNNNAQAGRANLYVEGGGLKWFHNGGVSLAESNSPIFDGNWHQVGISRKGNRFDLLRDSQVVATGNSTGSISQAQWWNIARARSFGSDFDGSISDVKIYNTDYSSIYSAWQPSPANKANGVALNTPLAWKTGIRPDDMYINEVNPNITSHYLYLHTEPNFVSITPIIISAGSPTEPSASYITAFQTDKTYYWRVDESVNNSLPGDANTLIGTIWSFETVKSIPVVTLQPVALVVAGAGEAAEFTASFSSISALTYQWYKSIDNSNNTANDDTAVGTNSNTFTRNNVQIADEGYYYCIATNAGGQASSNVGKLKVKKLLGYWKLDGDANDSSGNGNHGTLLGASGPDPNWVGGIDGQALNAYGTNYIEISNESFFDHYDTMTVSAWVKGANFGVWEAFVSKHSSITGWELIKSGAPNVAGFIVRRGTDYLRSESIAGTTNIEDNNWHMVIAVLNGLTGQRQLYVDGLLEASAVYDYTQMLNGGDAPVRIAVTQFDAVLGSPVTGVIDEVKIYNYALEPLQIATEYAVKSGKDVCLTPPALDYNGNCQVELGDFAEFAANWLDCGIVPDCVDSF